MVEKKEVKWRSLYSIPEQCKVCNRGIATAKLNDKGLKLNLNSINNIDSLVDEIILARKEK